MTLEDAIVYYSEMAKECRRKARIESNDYMDMKDRVYEAEQLADWLNELKVLRERIDVRKTEWIPCKESMPTKDGAYLVSGRWASGKESVGDCDYSKEDGYFHTAWNFDVLAWRELPEPYKERREE